MCVFNLSHLTGSQDRILIVALQDLKQCIVRIFEGISLYT